MSISKNAPASIVSVPFQGDTLEAVQTGDGKIMVSIKRVCESLGIDVEGQRKKLATCEWATTEFISAVAQDGKQRRLAMIDLESLPMWLATITASKVKAAVRPKLLQFQREARNVLAAWFLGTCRDNPELAAAIVELRASMEDRLSKMERQIESTRKHKEIYREEARASYDEADDAKRRLAAIIDPENATIELPYMPFREFCRVFKVKDMAGHLISDLPATVARDLSRRVADLSRDEEIEIRVVGSGFRAVNTYSLAVLAFWFRMHERKRKNAVRII